MLWIVIPAVLGGWIVFGGLVALAVGGGVRIADQRTPARDRAT